MKKQNKTFKIIFALCCFLAFSVSAFANTNIPGVGVVVKRNPGGGASKVTTDKDGNFNLEMIKGSYLVSLDKAQLMKVGQELVKTLNPKSTYLFNGNGTQLVIAENENIIISQLEGSINTDLLLITVIKPTTLSGSLLWDNSVVDAAPAQMASCCHITLLKRNASQSLQIFCPTGTVGLNGKCVPIKDLEDLPVGKSADYVGHVTLLKKNASAIRASVCPDGYKLKDGICVQELPSTDNQPQARTEGGPIGGQIIKTGGNSNPSGPVVVTVPANGGGTHKIIRTGHVTLMRFSKPQIYIGGGVFSPSSTTKEAGVVNGIDLNLSVYKPIWVWEQSGITLGINAGGGYMSGNGDYTLDNRYTVYQLQGQSAPPVVAEKGAGSPKNQGFKFETGAQMNIHLGDITVSPIFNVGYLNIEQKSFTVTETVQENTVDYPYVLLDQKATKTNGLGIIPKVRLAYNITPRIGIWIEGSYIMGPKIETESTRFVLDPSIPSDSYNLGHFQEGQYITTKSETKYSGIGINGGIVIGLGKGTGSPKSQNFKNETGSTTTNIGIVEETLNCKCCGKEVSGTFGQNIEHTKTCCKKKDTALMIKMQEEMNIRHTASTAQNSQDGGNALVQCSCCKEAFKDDDEYLAHKCSKGCFKIDLPNTGTIKNVSIKAWGDGTLTKDGTPIINGTTIVGTITGIKKPAEIKITQIESNDIGSATTDEKGNFIVTVAKDTIHKIYVDGVEYGKIKIVSKQENDGYKCDCCTATFGPEQLIIHAKTCCPKVENPYQGFGEVSDEEFICLCCGFKSLTLENAITHRRSCNGCPILGSSSIATKLPYRCHCCDTLQEVGNGHNCCPKDPQALQNGGKRCKKVTNYCNLPNTAGGDCSRVCDDSYTSFCGMTVTEYDCPDDASSSVAVSTVGTKSFVFSDTDFNDYSLVAPEQILITNLSKYADGFAYEYAAIVQVGKKYYLAANYSKEKDKLSLVIPLMTENNYLYLSGNPVRNITAKGKTTTTTLPTISQSKKHEYVGHVTLMR